VIDGAKAFITNSGTPITSVITVTARTGELPDGRPEISSIMVPAGTPGLEVEPGYRKLGWHASDTHGLSFSGCRVPAENLLGERGRGFHQFLATLDDGGSDRRSPWERLGMPGCLSGLRRSAGLHGRSGPTVGGLRDRLVAVSSRGGAAAHLPGGLAARRAARAPGSLG
jgi:hypothetical protein